MSYNRRETLDCKINPNKDCGVEAALSIVSGKWKLRIYKALRQGGPTRFSILKNGLGDISEKTLTAQLREMEYDGLLIRITYAEVPPRVEYSLTDLGQKLEPLFLSLEDLGLAYILQKMHHDSTEKT
ncbi:winged helix-turn-helix transcriptional regulator [Mucilaginibacter pedocola]|uniref:MarR family transcriptional regulator n=1 Tax=Mucilaginibacter pedocola TaxID=1792845 RepID=A0A1S9PA71_9SPHI|nr:helix-turn-helix domain-containing protein [Mucilaginibacter pedocola]OOQ57852.1 MarR family transcriptional regulator [Mucilaginibacter pedocola]